MNQKNNKQSENLETIIFKGVPILRFDFHKKKEDEVVAAITTGTYYIQNNDESDLRLLVVTTGMSESGEIHKKFRKSAVEIAHKCQKIAIVGGSKSQKLVVKSINTIIATSVHSFDSEEDARDWLSG